jgi:heat shock protein HslJ
LYHDVNCHAGNFFLWKASKRKRKHILNGEKRMKKILILGLLMILVLAACASGEGSPSIEGQWALVSYGPVSGQISAMTDVETNIEFTNGQMGGNVGCNGFGGEYTVEGGTIAFGPVMSTMMFCEEIAANRNQEPLRCFRNPRSSSSTGTNSPSRRQMALP